MNKPTIAQVEQRRKAGEALRDQRGREYYSRIGKLGGRPTWDVALERAKEREAAILALSKPGRKPTRKE